MGNSRTARRRSVWRTTCSTLLVTASVLLSLVPSAWAVATNPLTLPAAKLPKGLHTVGKASHTLTFDDIAAIADGLTADVFRRDGMITAYEQRLEGSSAGNRTLIDTFVFKTAAGAGDSRGIWTWETAGDQLSLAKVPKSVQAFEHQVSAPGVPGWEVEVIFRKGRALLDVDTRYPGTGPAARSNAQLLATQTTQAYAAWLDQHPA